MKARKSLIFNSMLMFCLLHILLHNLPKAVNARAILQSISTFTSGTELPRKTKPFTFSISFPSIVICCCDEVRTFHSPLLIFIPHSVQASCNCDVSSCNFCIIGIFNNCVHYRSWRSVGEGIWFRWGRIPKICWKKLVTAGSLPKANQNAEPVC